MASPLFLARRSDAADMDYFPTPPWVTRALVKYVVPGLGARRKYTILEPACGGGHMVRALEEYRHVVTGYDVVKRTLDAYGVRDFINDPPLPAKYDFVVTNPPYENVDAWIRRSKEQSKIGAALLLRVQALEGKSRYYEFFRDDPPTVVALFSGRIDFAKNKVVRKAPKFFFHIWVYWDKTGIAPQPLIWIPWDARQLLEKDSDYED